MQLQDYYQTKQIYYKMNRTRKEAILALLEKNKTGLILDVGCGSGELGEAIKGATKYNVWGIDISDNFIEQARKKMDDVFCFDITSDFNSWPGNLKTAQFDKIILSEVLEHLFLPEDLLKNLKKLINEKVELIITVPNIIFWKNRIKILFGNFDYTEQGIMDRGHIHFFSWKSLKKIIADQGFKIIETRHFVPTRGTKWLGKIFPGLFVFQFIIKVKLDEN